MKYTDTLRALSRVLGDSTDEEINIVLNEAADKIDMLGEELAHTNTRYYDACSLVAKMHAAAVGYISGPQLGVVEDVANIKKDSDRYHWLRSIVTGEDDGSTDAKVQSLFIALSSDLVGDEAVDAAMNTENQK